MWGYRIFWIGAGILLIGGCFVPVAGLWMEHRAALDSIEGRLADLKIARLDPREAELRRQALAQGSEPGVGLLTVGRGSEAAIHLETAIRSAAELHGATVEAILVERPATGTGTPAISASVRISAPNDRIEPLIKSLETGPPAIFFERLALSAGSARGDRQETIIMQAAITAYLEIPFTGKAGA